jgi:hypothetical protein
MAKSMMQSVISQLQKERNRLEGELHRVSATLSAFGKAYMRGAKSKAAGSRKTRTISAAGRRRIAAAQRKRWAKIRAAKKQK